MSAASPITRAIAHAVTGADLPRAEMAEVIGQIMDGEATPAQITTIMDGWRPFRTWSSVLTRVSGDRLGLELPARPDSSSRLRR